MKVAHLTTVDLSLRYLVLPQLVAAAEQGEAIGISAPGEFVPEIEALGIRHVALKSSTRGMSPSADVAAALELWRALKRESPDVLHTHNPKPGLYGRIVGRLAGVPIVVNTVHGLYATEESPTPRRLAVYSSEWLAGRFSDAELIQSPEDFELLTSRRIFPRSKTVLLGNGVDLERFNPANARAHRASIRTELGLGEDTIVVGMVGRLVEEKGVPELIEVAEMLDDRYRVVIAGPHDPDKADSIPRAMIDRGESAGVMFLGMRRDVDRLYGAFDLFVLPSHREGFPRAAMEAAASGLPVVASDIRGCRQVVEAGITGSLFAVGDAEALFEAIEEVGSSASLRTAMSTAAVEKAQRQFDERDVVRIVMDTYAQVARAKGLEWTVATVESPVVRRARRGDEAPVAELHRRMISTGFLSSLGHRFLSTLYGAMIDDPDSEVLVADADGVVVGFVAGTRDTGAFYKYFLKSRFLRAGLALIPSLLRPTVWKRVYESLRYGGGDHARASAELLSMAVAPAARRRGLGSELVEALLRWGRESNLTRMKVVVGTANMPATALYNKHGFVNGRQIEVHSGSSSWEFIWSA